MIEKHERIKVYVCSEDATAYIGTSEVELHGYGNGDGELVLRDVSFGVDEIRDAQVKTLKADVEFYKNAWTAEKELKGRAKPERFSVRRSDLVDAAEWRYDVDNLVDILDRLDIDVEEEEGMEELRSVMNSVSSNSGLMLDDEEVSFLARGLLKRGVRVVE